MSYRKLLPERESTPHGVVYLLCFREAFGHAKHYLGFTTDLEARLREHARGTGGIFMRKVRAAGITWTLARTWNNATLRREYQLKNQGGARRLCPYCRRKD